MHCKFQRHAVLGERSARGIAGLAEAVPDTVICLMRLIGHGACFVRALVMEAVLADDTHPDRRKYLLEFFPCLTGKRLDIIEIIQDPVTARDARERDAPVLVLIDIIAFRAPAREVEIAGGAAFRGIIALHHGGIARLCGADLLLCQIAHFADFARCNHRVFLCAAAGIKQIADAAVDREQCRSDRCAHSEAAPFAAGTDLVSFCHCNDLLLAGGIVLDPVCHLAVLLNLFHNSISSPSAFLSSFRAL